MAKEGRTEKATPKRREEARKEGQVLNSKELKNFMVFLSFFIGVVFFQDYIAHTFYRMMFAMFNALETKQTGMTVVFAISKEAIILILSTIFLVYLFIFVNYILQVGFIFNPKAIQPKGKRINPANYWKQIGNMKKTGFELIKNLVLFLIIIFVIILTFYNHLDNIQNVLMLSWIGSLSLFKSMLTEFAMKLGVIFLVIGIVDYIFQKKEYEENLKMKKEELKEEHKEQNGRPEVKQKQSEIRNKILEKKVKKELEDAHLVIVNPTHYAVAIRYKKEKKDVIPRVVAKGVDELALLIKKLARENNIPIIENKPVARKIYYQTDEQEFIDEEMYEIVGKILAKLVNENKISL